MSERFNPYYSPDKLNLSAISFEDPGSGSYDYNTALFVRTNDGRLFFCFDSGCSCPTPFEEYEAETADQSVQSMTRIEGFEDAWQQLRSWGKDYNGQSFIDDADRSKLKKWFSGEI